MKPKEWLGLEKLKEDLENIGGAMGSEIEVYGGVSQSLKNSERKLKTQIQTAEIIKEKIEEIENNSDVKEYKEIRDFIDKGGKE